MKTIIYIIINIYLMNEKSTEVNILNIYILKREHWRIYEDDIRRRYKYEISQYLFINNIDSVTNGLNNKFC